MLVFTILGCGSSTGVPRIGNDWGACDPNEPRNRRRRTSLLIERYGPDGRTVALIDTGPDLREQLNDVGVRTIDGVLYTHDHADHTHGIDDLRVAVIRRRARITVHADARTIESLRTRFGYCFATPPGSGYPPILNAETITGGDTITIDGEGGAITVHAYEQEHGNITSLGYRCGDFAYSCDLSAISDVALSELAGLDVWVVDALRWRPHPTHFCVGDSLSLINKVAPRRAILTNLHMDLDYRTLVQLLPDGVEPAYDGLRIEFPDR